MESMFDRATRLAGTQLTKMRWALGLNGVLSIAFAVAIIIWPDISLEAPVILFGAYARDRHRRAAAGLSGAAPGERGWSSSSSLLGSPSV
jgi:hypothetical protein